MPEFSEQRGIMIRDQLIARGLEDDRVTDAMERVPRHRFVPESLRSRAYDDGPLSIGCGQTISQPYMVAHMTALLALEAGDRVLEIGTGSGYQTAVLALLAEEVVTIERHAALSHVARDILNELGIRNVRFRVGDGTMGCPEHAPYKGIIVTAGGPKVPPALLEQLALGGRLVCPVGTRECQELHVIRRTDAGYETAHGTRCMFVPLVGEGGW
jgi:protein-L-isoaspartate(D-aspartate) O-methyltransferase